MIGFPTLLSLSLLLLLLLLLYMLLMTFLMYDLPTECASVAMEMSHRQLPPTERWRNRKRHAWCFMGQLMDPGLQSRKGDFSIGTLPGGYLKVGCKMVI